MELAQTVAKPKEEIEPKPGSRSDDAAKYVEQATVASSHVDSAFVSASHEFAVKQYQAAITAEDSSADLAKAERVALSMGLSQRYDKNPFDHETQRELARAFEAGERQQERIRDESRIGKDDRDMEYDN
jgi:hypothetical protein